MLSRLDNLITGRVVLPADADWADARQAFNTDLDVRPAAVAFPVDAADVRIIVDYARSHGLRIAPQATGHNAGPLVDIEDTILVNVRELQEVSIDPAAMRVRVGAGVKWEKVAPRLSDHGLAGLHGSSPDVGIAGYSLGGGMGWLARKHGLQANSVTAMELVTADGRFVRTDAEHEPELFWALRGGGGNFGVVTAIEFRVYPLEELYAGAMFFPFERAAEVLHTWRKLLPTFPEEMMTWASILHFPPAPFVPEFARGRSFTVVMGAFMGEEAEGRSLLRAVRDLGPAVDTFAMVPPIELGDLAMDPPDPLPVASTHRLLRELSAEALDEMLEITGPGGAAGTSVAMFQLRHLGGALARKAPGAGARATLPGQVSLFALGVPMDEETGSLLGASLAALHHATAPYDAGDYPNFVEEPAEVSAFFDEATWARLRAVKAQYDPTDLFRGNHHVP
ncbi:MAG TPA: FAD-binding oxidoreductase, partial [Solirubrobacteraceae bacterium]|nr:FAD-binding oxidoreductase [Solirubrobacteraceae bacterium]